MESKDNPMTEMGIANIFPPKSAISAKGCKGCGNFSQCWSSKGLEMTVRGIRHLFLPDYKNSWVLVLDLPECKQPERLFSLAKISASLYTGNRARFEGKVFKYNISQSVELHVVEI
jgi:hypothetical protein